MNFLGLLWGGGFSSADGPNRFVGEYNIRPVLDSIGKSLGLAEDYSLGLTGFTFLQRFTDASDDLQSLSEGMDYLIGDQLVGFTEQLSAFRMTNDDPCGTNVLQQGWRNLPSKCTAGNFVTILKSIYTVYRLYNNFYG